MPDGRELLAQTTISPDLVREKAERLLTLASDDRVLYVFGPEASKAQCPAGIVYQPIEGLIPRLIESEAGRWLVDRMLPTVPPTKSAAIFSPTGGSITA